MRSTATEKTSCNQHPLDKWFISARSRWARKLGWVNVFTGMIAACWLTSGLSIVFVQTAFILENEWCTSVGLTNVWMLNGLYIEIMFFTSELLLLFSILAGEVVRSIGKLPDEIRLAFSEDEIYVKRAGLLSAAIYRKMVWFYGLPYLIIVLACYFRLSLVDNEPLIALMSRVLVTLLFAVMLTELACFAGMQARVISKAFWIVLFSLLIILKNDIFELFHYPPQAWWLMSSVGTSPARLVTEAVLSFTTLVLVSFLLRYKLISLSRHVYGRKSP